MLDIAFIREQTDFVKEGASKKGSDPKIIDEVLTLDEKRREALTKLEDAQSKLNQISKKIASVSGEEKTTLVKEASELSAQVKELKPEVDTVNELFRLKMLEIPNPPLDDVVEGKSDADNQVNRTVGEPTKFDFQPLDHVAIGEKLDLIDIERAGKISGSRFYFLKNEMVILEFALIQYAMSILVKEGFSPIIPPILLNKATMLGAGYLPAGEDEIYKTQDETYLAGTAEQPLAGIHMDEVLDAKKFPIRYAGFSSCFRREAGSHGKDVRGILRAHQFDKVEMFSYVEPKDSPKEHDYLVSIEEKIVKGLDLPYQVIDICSGDLGAPAAKKFDIETWMPGQDKYRETHSCSNCTDFQARRLNIKYRDGDGKLQFVHTLNGTAIAIGRMLIAIVENNQQRDGAIKIPDALVPYCGFDTIKPKS
jgi:seryl-tRNA synthetase